MLLQQAQAVSPRRNPLRKDRQKLSRSHHTRSHHSVVEVTVHRT
jgi:hypothetical protein